MHAGCVADRTAKLDNLNELATYYTYDIDDTETYGTNSNRLQFYEVWDTSGESSALVSTTWYIYDDLTFDGDDDLQWVGEGNPVRIITEQTADPGVYSAVHFVYDLGQRVWVMYGESWEEDGLDEDDCPDNYAITWAREFRYDGGRARYLNRELDPEQLQDNGVLAALEDSEEMWTVYDPASMGRTDLRDVAYADYMVEEDTPYSTITDLRIYEPGVALKDPIDESTGIEYYHADHLGTTRAMTDYAGASASSTVYTAFGERIDAGGYQRYGYVGAYGYQAHDFPDGSAVRFLHVGWRYYDPGTGRFLQRDPIGIAGGKNAYMYVFGRSTIWIDPSGWRSDVVDDIDKFIDRVVNGKVAGGAGAGTGAALAANYKWKLGIGKPINILTVWEAGIWFGWNGGKYICARTGIDKDLGQMMFNLTHPEDPVIVWPMGHPTDRNPGWPGSKW